MASVYSNKLRWEGTFWHYSIASIAKGAKCSYVVTSSRNGHTLYRLGGQLGEEFLGHFDSETDAYGAADIQEFGNRF